MHYKRKKFNYLFIANKRTMTSPVGKITWTNTVRCGNIICYRQSRGSSDSLDSEEEVPTGRWSFPLPCAFESNYHYDADSTGSDDWFQGFDLEVADRTSGTYL